MRSLKLTPRQILIVLHDLLATAAAIVVTFFMRFEGAELNARLRGLWLFLPFFVIYAATVYFIIGLAGPTPEMRAFRISEREQHWNEVEYVVAGE